MKLKMLAALALGLSSGVYAADTNKLIVWQGVVQAWRPISPALLRLATVEETAARIDGLKNERSNLERFLESRNAHHNSEHFLALQQRIEEIDRELATLRAGSADDGQQ